MTVTEAMQSGKVLFVDDEENILRAISRLFLDEPYVVLTAISGAAGLEVLRREPDVCVIVSDQRMPGMSGAEFLAQSRTVTPDAVRLVLTGYADIAAAVDAINKGGAWKYLAKPWKDEEFLQTVREALERYGLLAENRRLSEVIRQQNEDLKKWNTELEAMVQQQTIEIQNKNKVLEQANDRLRKNFTDMLYAFAALLELRNRSAGSHSRTVSELAASMARSMELPPDETGTITVAALLHDIGKIGIPDALVGEEPERMRPEELELYRMHSVRGQVAVDAIVELRKAGQLIRHHHERFDGNGFPDRLRGNAIPLGSRIIALADLFDRRMTAMREGADVGAALEAVRKELGTAVDHDLFSVLENAVRRQYGAPAPQPPKPAKPAPVLRRIHEREVLAKNLREGMVLARDIRSGTGLLLLCRGTELTERNIETLSRYFEIDPSTHDVYIIAEQ